MAEKRNRKCPCRLGIGRMGAGANKLRTVHVITHSTTLLGEAEGDGAGRALLEAGRASTSTLRAPRIRRLLPSMGPPAPPPLLFTPLYNTGAGGGGGGRDAQALRARPSLTSQDKAAVADRLVFSAK